ncbi:uncharacterized protein V1510DRAFT_356621, partial [Dipodascopsis tothii]|uniref:uncharacterized protein n=1 Tax=Dipodascopsis tothii TaxID=44089 RepID=UPI0034CE9B72
EEIARGRAWVAALTKRSIPRDQFDMIMSRSSGPGGQHVNKVNSKATIRAPWKTMDWIPEVVRMRLETEGFQYLTKTGKIVVQSEIHRRQHDNLEDCFDRLCAAIKSTAHFPEDMSEATIERWRQIKHRANEDRLEAKRVQADKKRAR